MHTTVEKITPERAGELIANNAHTNRPLDRSHVRRLADIIERGEWLLTHQGIAVTGNTAGNAGDVIDGQHRLAAIVLADLPVEVTVTYGADPTTFTALDANKVRGGADTLALAGLTNPAKQASAAKVLYAYSLARPHLENFRVSNKQALDLALEYGGNGALLDAVNLGRRLHVMAPSVAAAACYLMQQADPDVFDTYHEGLSTGAELRPDDPRLKLRETLTTAQRIKRVRPPMWQLALAAKTWNAVLEDRTIRTLLWRSDEPLPVFARRAR